MRVSAIRLKKLPPFQELTIEFPEKTETRLGEVQIITGQNGTGKTRLLCALASCLGSSDSLSRRIEGAHAQFGAIVDLPAQSFLVWGLGSNYQIVSKATAKVELENSPFESGGSKHFRTVIQQQETSKSPVSALAFAGTTKIEDAKIEAMQTVSSRELWSNLLFETVDEETRKKQSNRILQSMANLKTASAYEHMRKSADEDLFTTRSTRIIERLDSCIRAISGKEFWFEMVPHPELSIQVHWGKDRMKLNTLPDGLRSILGWLAACACILANDFPEHHSPLDIPVVLLLDEPESHLHPAWQQRLIPAAQMLLPNAQIIIATHSPFVISSVNSGHIHILSESDGRIEVSDPMPCSKGDTWIDAVEDALGLKTWYDPETEELLSKFRKLREEGISKKEVTPELKQLAQEIAGRSDSLNNLIGSEMYQLQRMIEGSMTPR